MQFRYNYDEMLKCSANLNKVFQKPVSSESLYEFYCAAMEVEWEGTASEKYREEVKCIVDIIKRRKYRMTQELRQNLKHLADWPRVVALKAKEFDSKMSNELNGLKF